MRSRDNKNKCVFQMSNSVNKLPNHVGIIMDGNSRWADKNGFDKYFGHKKGIEIAKIAVKTALELGVKHLSLYAFSTENWNRPSEEVSWLMHLLKVYLHSETKSLVKQGVSVKIIGDLSRLQDDLRNEIEETVSATSKNTKMHLYIAFSYGGRQEILDACKKAIASGVEPQDLTLDSFGDFLYVPDMPDLDLVIRTGKARRISNYMLWHIAYAELYFTDEYWPEFSESVFHRAIEFFSKSNRTFGRR